jgi:WD40 repeat protein
MKPTTVRTPSPVHEVAIDPSGRWIVTADAEAVRRYDLHKIPVAVDHPIDLSGGEVVTVATGARGIAFHPTRELLAVAIGTGLRIVTFDGNRVADLPAAHGEKARVVATAFDAAGETIATADASGLIKLWSLDRLGSLKFLRDLVGHSAAVYALAFSADGRTLASGGDDRAVILWDPAAGQERLSLAGHADRVMRIAFNADGTALISVSRDGAVKRWRADVRPAPDGSRFQMGLPGV